LFLNPSQNFGIVSSRTTDRLDSQFTKYMLRDLEKGRTSHITGCTSPMFISHILTQNHHHLSKDRERYKFLILILLV